jgi:ABC-type nitrate/sulfonate/bicarbonate transport system substrate-binding protein
VSDNVKQARKALARGHPDEAVALLWNAIEPARLAGDRRALATIEHLALSVSREDDESQRREAEKLLAALRRASEAADRPETGRGEVGILTAADDGEPVGEKKVGTQPGRGIGLSTIIWLLVVIAIVILNILGQGRG